MAFGADMGRARLYLVMEHRTEGFGLAEHMEAQVSPQGQLCYFGKEISAQCPALVGTQLLGSAAGCVIPCCVSAQSKLFRQADE